MRVVDSVRLFSRLSVCRCRRGSLCVSVWSLVGDLCRWLGREVAAFVDSRGRVVSYVSIRTVSLTEMVRLLLKVVWRAVVPRIVVRVWAMPFVLLFYREVTEWHALDVDAEGFFCLRSGRGARVGSPEWASSLEAVVHACRVLRVGHGLRIWLGGDVAVGVEPENCEKLSKNCRQPPSVTYSNRGRLVRVFSSCAKECRVCGSLRWFVI